MLEVHCIKLSKAAVGEKSQAEAVAGTEGESRFALVKHLLWTVESEGGGGGMEKGNNGTITAEEGVGMEGQQQLRFFDRVRFYHMATRTLLRSNIRHTYQVHDPKGGAPTTHSLTLHACTHPHALTRTHTITQASSTLRSSRSSSWSPQFRARPPTLRTGRAH